MNIQTFSNLLIQYNGLANQIVAQARFRYNFSEGKDVYLVYNENFNSNRENGLMPKLPATQDRIYVIEFLYTFVAKQSASFFVSLRLSITNKNTDMKKIVLAALSILVLTTSFATGNKKQSKKIKQTRKCCDKGSCCDKTKDAKTRRL